MTASVWIDAIILKGIDDLVVLRNTGYQRLKDKKLILRSSEKGALGWESIVVLKRRVA